MSDYVGWVCPGCGHIYSPAVTECFPCGDKADALMGEPGPDPREPEEMEQPEPLADAIADSRYSFRAIWPGYLAISE